MSISCAVPAQLLLGSHDRIVPRVMELLKKQFCLSNSCGVCRTCIMIQEVRHPSVMWLSPDRQYKTEQIDEVLHALSFKLEEDQHHFFIFTHAELLTTSCANRLLKSLEEPPAGYHFILLCEQKELLLPTIRSRCAIAYCNEYVASSAHDELFFVFTTAYKTVLPSAFLLLLQKIGITDQESKPLFERILTFWVDRFKKHPADTQAMLIMNVLQRYGSKLPTSGSSKLFWLNLFLQIND